MANHAALIRTNNAGKTILRRGRRFIEFDDGNGKTKFVTTIDPLHIRNSETEIDASFVVDTGAWQWKMAAGDFEFHARSVFNVGNVMEWRKGSSWTILDPQSINWINQDTSRQQIAIKQAVTGQVSDHVLSFPNAYGTGRHFRYEAHPRHLKKFITIDSLSNLPAPSINGTIWFESEFTLSTSNDVVFYIDGVKWAKTNGVRVKTANRIEIRDAATETDVLWFLDAPRAIDAAGKFAACEYEVRRDGGPSSLFITVRVPRAWLLTASYPVEIDPTFTDGYGGDVETAMDALLYEPSSTTNYGTYIYTEVGTEPSGPNKRERTVFKFDVSSISGSTVDSATLTIRYRDAGASVVDSPTINLYSILSGNSDWSESQCSWDNRKTSTAWAGSGGCGSQGTDYSNTTLGSSSTWVSSEDEVIDLTVSEVQAWVDGSNYGLLMKESSEPNTERRIYWYGSSDNSETGNRPTLTVVYTSVINLVVNDASCVSQTDAVALTQVHSLTVNDAACVSQADAAVLTQLHVLTVPDAFCISQVDAVNLVHLTIIRPASDAYVGSWTNDLGGTTNLYQSVDETAANDADYIHSEGAPVSSPVVFALGTASDPLSSSNHTLRYRYQREESGTINLTVQLRQSYTNEGSPGTLIAEWTHNGIAASLVTAEQTLTGGQADSITDYAALYVRLVAAV